MVQLLNYTLHIANSYSSPIYLPSHQTFPCSTSARIHLPEGGLSPNPVVLSWQNSSSTEIQWRLRISFLLKCREGHSWDKTLYTSLRVKVFWYRPELFYKCVLHVVGHKMWQDPHCIIWYNRSVLGFLDFFRTFNNSTKIYEKNYCSFSYVGLIITHISHSVPFHWFSCGLGWLRWWRICRRFHLKSLRENRFLKHFLLPQKWARWMSSLVTTSSAESTGAS